MRRTPNTVRCTHSMHILCDSCWIKIFTCCRGRIDSRTMTGISSYMANIATWSGRHRAQKRVTLEAVILQTTQLHTFVKRVVHILRKIHISSFWLIGCIRSCWRRDWYATKVSVAYLRCNRADTSTSGNHPETLSELTRRSSVFCMY